MAESNAVARREDAASWDMGVGKLPESIQHALELRKRAGMVSAQIAQQNWGQRMDLATRRAIAEYGRRFGVDVVTEIHVLGGNIYKNGAYWLRRLSELADEGKVEYAYADHVEDDPRLAKLGARGEDEQKRRAWERIQHGIPDKAAGAVVFHVKLRSMTEEVKAAKWCGGGTRKNDPVGEAEPIATAETRAARRAIRMVASHIPTFAVEMDEMDRVEAELQGVVRASHQRFAEQECRLAPMTSAALTPGGDDPYSETEPTASQVAEEREPEPVESGLLFGDDVGARPARRSGIED